MIPVRVAWFAGSFRLRFAAFPMLFAGLFHIFCHMSDVSAFPGIRGMCMWDMYISHVRYRDAAAVVV